MEKFFLVSGIILIVSGVLQAWVRPPRAGESRTARFASRATLRALVFVTVGVVGILVGVGVLQLPRPPG